MGNTTSSNQDLINKSQPMRIHTIHGKSLRITEDRLGALRFEGYADAVLFGSRPVEREEHIEMVIKQLISEWNGSLRFGFTYHSPETILLHKEGMPRYICPDLLKRGGCFVETMNYVDFKENDKIEFWVSTEGDVKMKVNGFGQRLQLKRVERDVYPVVDVYGNCKEITFRSLKDDYSQPIEINIPRHYTNLFMYEFPFASITASVDVIDEFTIQKRTAKKTFAWNKEVLPANHIWFLYIKDIDEALAGGLSIAIMDRDPATIISFPDTLKDFEKVEGLHFKLFENVYVRMTKGDEIAICIAGHSGYASASINGRQYDSVGLVGRFEGGYWIVANLNCGVRSIQSTGVHRISRHPLPFLPTLDEGYQSPDMLDSLPARPMPLIRTNTGLSLESMNCSTPRDSIAAPNTIEPTPRNSISGPNSIEPTPSADVAIINLLCIKCKKESPNILVVPCGHLVLCDKCNSPSLNKCPKPACTTKFKKVIRVYY